MAGVKMKELKKTMLEYFKESWTVCSDHCAACYYRGPLIPHDWNKLPPPEWSTPFHRCPSFEYFNFRAYTAVGRGIMASLVFDNEQFPITDDLMKIAYTCTSCGVCSEICRHRQPHVATLALREELVRRGAKRPEAVEKIDANIEKSGNIFGAKRVSKPIEGVPASGENIYFAGCTARFQEPEISRATIEVLKRAGMDIAYLGDEERCCGFVAGHDGNTWLLEQQAVQNVEALKKAGAKQVIVSCADCYKTFKIDYPLIVGELPFKVIHVSELFAKLIDEKKIKFTKEVNKEVTYHDPCFLGRHCKVYDEPRKVLESIPGIKLIEMERNRKWSYCCGSGAKIVSNCYPEFSATTTKERVLEGKKAADTIVTACTSCFSTMNKAVKKQGIEVEVCDISVLLAKAMGIEL
jgi:heterodisulfide reductase subunit D